MKPGDNRQLQITIPEMPKMPTSFSEFADLTIVTGSAVATAVGSFAQNAYASLSGNKEVGCNKEISLLHRPFLTPALLSTIPT